MDLGLGVQDIFDPYAVKHVATARRHGPLAPARELSWTSVCGSVSNIAGRCNLRCLRRSRPRE